MRTVRYNVAASLDGFIADREGRFDWIPADPAVDFESLFASVDTVLLGRASYETVLATGERPWPAAARVLVFSRTLTRLAWPEAELVRNSAAARVAALRDEAGEGEIWLFGGGQLCRDLLAAGQVDRLEVTVVPVLLGDGLPLVAAGLPRTALQLASTRRYPSGLVTLSYATTATPAAAAPAAARRPCPGDLAPDALRGAGAELFEIIADYHDGLAERPVLPAVTPAAVAARFTEPLPEQGVGIEEQLADWRERIEPLLMAVGSPRHFGFVNGSGAQVGIFADALAASVNTNAGGWRLGPAATEIERQALRWLSDLVGYPESAGGIVLTGGTMANTTALLTALRHLAPYDSTPAGLQLPTRRGRFLVYMSDHEGHISVTRAADTINLGREAVRRVPSRADFTLDPEALRRQIAADREAGDLPLAVVAQIGSINVGAIDPLDELADLCAAEGLWLHGDGACGLFAAALPEFAGRLRGIERADSLAGDPHKWLGVPYDCGVLLVREGERLRRAFSIAAPYLRPDGESEEEQGRNYLEYGPEMSRGWRALKLWMTLRALGRAGLREALGNGPALARHLHGLVRAHPDFEVLHEPQLYLYCYRYLPRDLAARADEPAVAAELDRLNQAAVDRVQASGLAFLMSTRIRGRVAIRLSICSQRTTAADIDRTFAALAAAAAELAAS